MTGMEAGAAAVRAGAALVQPSKLLWRWWKPPTDRVSVAMWADELAAAVQSAERDLRKDLCSGPVGFIRVDFAFAAVSQSRPGEVIESADASEIATYCESLDPPPRRLVILGEPGSGKTVAATYLVQGLLKTRSGMADAIRAEHPVPVRVNAAGWDGTTDFSGWLITRLGLDYPQLRPALTRKLVEVGLILPVIDGLDEMDTADSQGRSARALLDHLNNTWRSEPVIVVCRGTLFEQLCRQGEDNGLHAAATVTLQPLAAEQVSDHLTGHRDATGTTSPSWSTITTHVATNPHGPLATRLETPWMLGLAITVLRHDPKTADQLTACSTTDAVDDLLFAAQIPAAVTGREPKDEHRDYTSDDVRTWLQSLATHLDHRRSTGADGTAIRLDEIWEIAGTTRCRALHGLTVGIITTLAFGLPVGLLSGLASGVCAGLAFGVGFGLAFGGAPESSRANPIVWRVPGRSRWRGLPFGLSIGLAIGLVVGLPVGATAGLRTGLAAGLTAGLLSGLAGGLTAGLTVDDEERLRIAVDERRLVRDSAITAALVALPFGLSIGLAFGLVIGLRFGLPVGLAIGLGLGLGISPAAGRFLIATLVFRFTKAFPARPAIFLDWARRKGLLRVNGTAYQFRHETYRHWLQRQPPPLAQQ
ncbi:NACHT domain-containing protein [Nocardia sp. CA-135398]|uniref:NACHT domain-containing protein n=1 Tax=Nocardia sp. CA-135398 TaxID=3239977 RepID=UPI003D99CD22